MFGANKPAFGSTTPSTFGFTSGSTTGPFGQTAFGSKPSTSGFQATGFGSTGSSLFGGGNTTTASGGLFGSGTTSFGQAQTTQPSFGFTGGNTSTGIFGAPQQNASSGLFGSSGSAFGQNKPAFGFGSSGGGTGLFGQQQQQAPSLFGQSGAAPNANLFGSGGFGGASGGPVGTIIKFNAPAGSDTMVKNGVTQTINTRHQCITCMKEYEAKSLEELRMEDYVANRKGPQQQGNLFAAATSAQSSLFGSGPSTSSGGLFAQNQKPLFGATTGAGFGASQGLFGSTNQPSSSLFGKPAGFGTTAPTTNSFSFNTNPAGSVFGANNQNKQPFGTLTSQGSTLFGQQTAQPSTGFGATQTAFGSTFGSQPNQNIGLFNQPKPFMNTTTATGFAFGGQNTGTNSGSLFGGAKPTGTAFGTPFGTGTAAGSFGNAFSNNQNTGLFNQSFKPPSTGFSFGQPTNTTTGLGAGLNIGGGQPLFGNAATKPATLFGNNTGGFTNTAFGTGSTFGTGAGLGTPFNMSNNPMLMGSATVTGTNQQPTSSIHQQIIALTTMPFGDSPLFRNLNPATGKAEELLKPTDPAAQKAALSNSQYKVSPRTPGKVKVKPLGASVLTKKSLFDGLEDDDPSLANSIVVPSTNIKHLVLPPRSSSSDADTTQEEKENVRTGTGKLKVANFSARGDSLKQIPKNDKKEADGQRNETANVDSPAQLNFSPESSGTRTAKDLADTPAGIEDLTHMRRNVPLRQNRLNYGPEIEKTIISLRNTKMPNTTSDEDKEVGGNDMSNQSSTTTEDSHGQSSEELPEVAEDALPHPAQIVLRRFGYYTIPSMEDLATMVAEDGSCVVENFTVGRSGYGNIFYPESFDVAGLNLDEIVHIRHKEVQVYPDEAEAPPVGQGLNRKAQVTLDRVWPIDKTTHELITDPERLVAMKYEDILQRTCSKFKGKFVEYRPQTGSWVFKVDHFSKYGLSDSDEEDVPASETKRLKPLPPTGTGAIKQQQKIKEPSHGLNGVVPKVQGSPLNKLGIPSQIPVVLEEDEEMEEGGRKGLADITSELPDGEEKVQSPTTQLAKQMGTSSHEVQLMKASFFDDDLMSDEKYDGFLTLENQKYFHADELNLDTTVEDEAFPKLQKSFGLFRTRFADSDASPLEALQVKGTELFQQTHFQQIPTREHEPLAGMRQVIQEQPKSVVVQHHNEALPLTEAIIGKNTRCVADTSLFKSRSFRVGWGPECYFIHCGEITGAGDSPKKRPSGLKLLSGPAFAEEKCLKCVPVLHRVGLMGSNGNKRERFKESIEQHLNIQLQYSMYGEEDGCPVFAPRNGVNALHSHRDMAEKLCASKISYTEELQYVKDVWELCTALWGNLSDMSGEAAEDNSHQWIMARREAVSNWLEDVTGGRVEDEVASVLGQSNIKPETEDHVPAIFSFLSGGKLLEACIKSQEYKDHYSALMLSLAGGGQVPRQLIQKQLANWQEVEADNYISFERLKLFTLVAGIPVLPSSSAVINTCENLDWKRAFAIHLWYLGSPISSVTDALLEFENSYMGETQYSCCPRPPYLEDGNMDVFNPKYEGVYDLCYHLLKLYSTRSHPLEKLLNPISHTPDPLDFSLSWLLLEVLCALGYTHVSPYSAALIHTSFAEQLESHGLWHWAIFVLLHINGANRRKSCVLDILSRHVELSMDEDYLEIEMFLREELHVPAEWIFEAKAMLAAVHHRHREQAWYLIKAGLWNESHETIVRYIAPDTIINENYEYLRELLIHLSPPARSSTISNWANGGAVFLEYMEVLTEVDNLQSNRDLVQGYELERLQPKLINLCASVVKIPSETAKERLCQSEIAKRTANLVRAAIVLQKGEPGASSRVLAHLVSQLPLPEDYALQELRQLLNTWVLEVTSS